MIVAASSDSLVQRSPSGEQRSLRLVELTAGLVVTGENGLVLVSDPDAIALPAWPDGSTEFLFRTAVPDQQAKAAAHLHRRLVNAVHAELVASGRIATRLSEYFAAEGPRPRDHRVSLPCTMPEGLIAAIEASQRRG